MINPAFTIRSIQKSDNKALAEIIRNVLTEHKANKPGTVFTDPTTDHLNELFQTQNAAYWVAEENGQCIGGCGLFPTDNLPEKHIELVKLYLLKGARGKGIGKALIKQCIGQAKEWGYHYIYLESLPELKTAVNLYEKMGFRHLEQPLGQSGHFACDLWMVLEV